MPLRTRRHAYYPDKRTFLRLVLYMPLGLASAHVVEFARALVSTHAIAYALVNALSLASLPPSPMPWRTLPGLSAGLAIQLDVLHP